MLDGSEEPVGQEKDVRDGILCSEAQRCIPEAILLLPPAQELLNDLSGCNAILVDEGDGVVRSGWNRKLERLQAGEVWKINTGNN